MKTLTILVIGFIVVMGAVVLVAYAGESFYTPEINDTLSPADSADVDTDNVEPSEIILDEEPAVNDDGKMHYSLSASDSPIISGN